MLIISLSLALVADLYTILHS